MERIKPRTLSGFMELLPARQTQFERMLETLRTTYALYGFTPLDTPVIESAEILLAKGGGETEKQICLPGGGFFSPRRWNGRERGPPGRGPISLEK